MIHASLQHSCNLVLRQPRVFSKSRNSEAPLVSTSSCANRLFLHPCTGTASVALEVHDVANKVDGIVVFADIMRIEAARDQIVVTREFGLQNASTPPLTEMNERSLKFYVPDNARVIGAFATTQNGFPLKSAPVPAGDKNRYSFNFPLRPGLTRFEVTYQLPYSGSANLDPKSLYPLEHFMVMLPKSIHFKAVSSSTGFKLIHLPNQPDVTVHVAEDTTDS